MTSLPQRKKSAEEIAKLREQIGVPDSDGPHAAAAIPAEAQITPPAAQVSPPSLPPARAAVQPEAAPFEAGSASPQPAPQKTKPCRSFRKSEQLPIESKPAPIPSNSPLPAKRHSRDEIEEIRRRELLSQLELAPPNPKFRAAHPAMIAAGYIIAAVGSTIFWREDFPWAATIACCACALLHALFLFVRTPVSRHHAGFISLIAMMIGVFASLQQFPQLQYGT